MPSRSFSVLGAPTSAAAHGLGQEKAPASFRAARIAELLTASGVDYSDLGDLTVSQWRSARAQYGSGFVNNLDEVIRVAVEVRDRIAPEIRLGRIPIVLGGDCTITVGVYAAMLREGLTPGLIYVDGGWDLSTPSMYAAGMMDSMGLGHLLDLEGATELADIGPYRPMLEPDMFVQFGHGPGSSDGPEEQLAEQCGFKEIAGPVVEMDPVSAARRAMSMLPSHLTHFHLHFDVDVVDFFDAPMADVPLYGNGISYESAILALRTFCRDPRFCGLAVTEFNPDHAIVEPHLTTRFVRDLVGAVSGMEPGALESTPVRVEVSP